MRHIVVSEENYEKLKTLGKFHNSFNDVITDVLKKAAQSDSQVGAWNQIAAGDNEPQDKAHTYV
jgi:predicted CopG family antitoxin